MLNIEDGSVKVLNSDLNKVSDALSKIWDELSTSKSKTSATIRGLLMQANDNLAPTRGLFREHIFNLPECKVCGEALKYDGSTHVCKPYEE